MPYELTESELNALKQKFATYGPIDEQGRSFLIEVTVELRGFKAVIRPNESQHRGRPHCLIAVDEKSATFDIKTGKRLAGDLGRWNSTAQKVISEESERLMKAWDETRPDDQTLN